MLKVPSADHLFHTGDKIVIRSPEHDPEVQHVAGLYLTPGREVEETIVGFNVTVPRQAILRRHDDQHDGYDRFRSVDDLWEAMNKGHISIRLNQIASGTKARAKRLPTFTSADLHKAS